MAGSRYWLASDFNSREEEGDLIGGGLRRVRAMHRIGFDGFSKILADCAFGGFGRVGGAHYFAVLGNGVLAFKNLQHNRTRGHEGNKVIIERAFLVNGVKRLCLGLAQLLALLGDDAEAGCLETGVDLTGDIAPRGIRLDDGEGSFEGHGFPFD